MGAGRLRRFAASNPSLRWRLARPERLRQPWTRSAGGPGAQHARGRMHAALADAAQGRPDAARRTRRALGTESVQSGSDPGMHRKRDASVPILGARRACWL